MADTVVKEMMSAYVAGCMDIRNLDQFIKFLDEGNYIPLDELGELQNIASLIPILLKHEAPPASLQNEIFSQIKEDEQPKEEKQETKRAKRKVNLSEIIKEELEDAPKDSEEEEEIKIPEKVSFTGLTRDTVANEVAEKIEEEIFASKKKSKREEKSEREIPAPEPEEEKAYPHVTIKAKTEKSEEKKIVIPPEEDDTRQDVEDNYPSGEFETRSNKNDLILKIVAGAGILFAIIFMIMYFSASSSYKEEIAGLQKILKANKIEIEDKTEFINQHLPLIEIFELKDLILVDLASTENAAKTEARIVISPSARRGVLQFITEPKISENESLQLWVINKGQSYSVGVFHPSPDVKFYQLSKIPFIPFDEIEMFRITKEPKSGSEFPSGNTVYFGAIRIK